ncbi:MAG: hypothetical protein RIR33_1884 [Pseudomonadota bacterium]|jgi:hypothetical protein
MTRLELQPSPFDRLDPVARAVRWWTSQMLDLAGAPRRTPRNADAIAGDAKRLPRHVAIMLPEEEGFLAEVSLAKGHADAHRQALALKLPDLAPIPAAEMCVTARAVGSAEDGAITYAVAMARRTRLDEFETKARKRGARSVVFHVGDSDIDLLSPTAEARRRRGMLIDAGIIAALALASVAASLAWTSRINAETEHLAQQERDLRGAAVAAETAREEAEVARALVERGILNRRSTVALDAIATLNQATPRFAWWTRLTWTPDDITIGAEAADATAAISALSSSAKAWSIELSGAIAAAQKSGVQAFELVARPRTANAP